MDDNEDHTYATARGTDPSTSHEAAEHVKGTALEALVYNDLMKHPGAWTAIEIAHRLNIHEWSISPRLKPLERKGEVDRSEKKLCYNSAGHLRNMIANRAIPYEEQLRRRENGTP